MALIDNTPINWPGHIGIGGTGRVAMGKIGRWVLKLTGLGLLINC